MWALIRKETLENARWFPLALLLTISLTVSAVYQGWLADISPLITNSMFGTSLLAIGFGLLQSITDQRNGARAYLLHLGVSASQVFWAKSLVGFGLVSAAVVLPLVGCALWLEMRGISPAPGRAIQVLPPLVIALTAFLFHPTVLLIIYRPARWLGSRIAPMAVPLGLLMFCQTTIHGKVNAGQLGVVVGASLILLWILLMAARRAYVDLAREPAASSNAHRSWATRLVLVSSMLMLVLYAGIAISTIDQAWRPSVNDYRFVVRNLDDQRLWLVRGQQRWSSEKNEYEMQFLSGAPLVDGQVPDIFGDVPASFRHEFGIGLPLNPSDDMYGISDLAYDSIGRGFINFQRWTPVVDRRGYVLCYELRGTTGRGLGQVISRDGIRDPQGDWGRAFDRPFEIDQFNREMGMIGDNHGVYRIDEKTGTIQTVVAVDLDNAYMPMYVDQPLTLFVRSGQRLQVYHCADDSGTIIESGQRPKYGVKGTMKAALVEEVELPELVAQLPVWNIFYRGRGDWTVHGTGGVGSGVVGSIAELVPGQKEVKSFTVMAPPEVYAHSMRDVYIASGVSAPLPALLQPWVQYLRAGRQQHKSLAEVVSVPQAWLPWVVATFLLQGLAACGLTWFATQRRGLSRGESSRWCLLALGLGWAIPTAVLACYPRVVKESCTHCHQPRRVDWIRCEHCQGNWEPAQSEGVEIIDSNLGRSTVGSVP